MTRRVIISSFGPELLNALVKGSHEKVEFSVPTYKAAFSFRTRAYALRKAMISQKHPLGSVVALTRITLKWDPKAPVILNSKNVPRPEDTSIPTTVTLQPNDSEFHDILVAAGVEMKDLSWDPLEEGLPPPRGGVMPDDIKSILDKYKPEDEKKS